MSLLFNSSTQLTLGIELELQVVNQTSYDLTARAPKFIKHIRQLTRANRYPWKIKPEITQSMLEINSSPYLTADALLRELTEIRNFLLAQADQLQFCFAGGGAHPFQKWKSLKIYPAPRFKNLSYRYGYLAKQFTVFGQHIHIGCKNGDDALYLIHGLARYVPHFIALSASSPFYQGIDTTFDSSRINVVNTFSDGAMPYLCSWEEFSNYFKKLYHLKIVRGIKDLYWDIRPQPEFGTVEIRICDTPLTVDKAVALAAYAQTLASYILRERPFVCSPDIYIPYSYNRFQASRYGFSGDFIDPYTHQHHRLGDDILQTIKMLTSHAATLHTAHFLEQVTNDVVNGQNDAKWLRDVFSKMDALCDVVRAQSDLWAGR